MREPTVASLMTREVISADVDGPFKDLARAVADVRVAVSERI